MGAAYALTDFWPAAFLSTAFSLHHPFDQNCMMDLAIACEDVLTLSARLFSCAVAPSSSFRPVRSRTWKSSRISLSGAAVLVLIACSRAALAAQPRSSAAPPSQNSFSFSCASTALAYSAGFLSPFFSCCLLTLSVC